mgnify:CR=1 FL=1
MTYHILIVEDDATMIESLKSAFNRLLGQCEVNSCGFANAAERIAETLPDVVVLDIFEDQVEGISVDAVEAPWCYIWDQHFCPVVFHSAHVVAQYQSLSHPFIRYELKDPGSLERVANHIQSFAPEIEGLRAVRRELAQRAGETLRHVSKLVWQPGKPAAEQADLFLRVVRRRMAAALDHGAMHEEKIQAWEQYIYPSIGEDLLTGDLIRATSGDQNDPQSYHLVLSPSCDLVLGQGPNEQVLVADCVPVDEYLEKAKVDSQKLNSSKHREKLGSELTKDQVAGLTVLPMFPGLLPLMAANLKKLSLLPYTDIATKKDETKLFTRITSVDSPFRERLAWAYLQVAGRPGVPDVDVEALAEAIAQTIRPNAKA